MIANVWPCIVSMDRLGAFTENSSMITMYPVVVSNFSKSSQAWKDKLKHWTYTCTFVTITMVYLTNFFPVQLVYNNF